MRFNGLSIPTKMSPKVTVLVPNYNHAPYLRQRIESVLQQTFHDFELILLDDASTDDSRVILDEYAAVPRVQAIVFNEVNSGSSYKQWNKGFSLSQGEYIWIAESDDYADPRFLETLVGLLDAHPDVGIAYCQSWRVNEHGQNIGTNQEYTDRLDAERWRQDYIAEGRTECAHYLMLQNTIPNASAVLFRRRVLEEVGYANESLRLSGDHDLYVRMLLVSDLAYVSRPLSFFRQHEKSVRSNTYRNGTYVREAYRVRRLILENVPVETKIKEQFFNEQIRHWAEVVRSGVSLSVHRAIYYAAKSVDPQIERRLVGFLAHALRNRLHGRRE